MALAVTHILTPLIFVDFYRHYFSKWNFSKNFVLLAGIAGIFPDIDIPLGWLLSFLTGGSFDLHRTYTHAVIWPILFFIISAIIIISNKQKYFSWNKRQAYLFFLMIGIGWGIHIILDCALAGNDILALIPLVMNINFCPAWASHDILAGIDAVFLILWISHEQLKHKIKDFV